MPVRNLRRPFPAPVTISATAPLAMELNGALAAARLRKVKRAILPDRPPASEQRPQVSRRAAAELCTDVDPAINRAPRDDCSNCRDMLAPSAAVNGEALASATAASSLGSRPKRIAVPEPPAMTPAPSSTYMQGPVKSPRDRSRPTRPSATKTVPVLGNASSAPAPPTLLPLTLRLTLPKRGRRMPSPIPPPTPP